MLQVTNPENKYQVTK